MDIRHRIKDRSIDQTFTPHRIITGALSLLVLALIAQRTAAQPTPTVNLPFNFKQSLYNEAKTLSSFIASLDAKSGEIVLNGFDSRRPAFFVFDWGDGTSPERGVFAMRHRYRSTARNYVASVMADYGTLKDTVTVLVRFIGPALDRKEIPSRANITVTIPAPEESLTLASRMPGYKTPDDQHFPDTAFTLVAREDIEYILTIATSIQMDIADYNVEYVNGAFKQFVLYDPQMEGGMISAWYTSPVTFVAGKGAFRATIDWSSFFHEIGHNVTLNFPKTFRFGGRIDGNANALFSETMAQIFQHTSVFETVNNYAYYGLPADIAFEIAQTGLSSMRVVRNAYIDYVNGGRRFTSWNRPSTDEDETFGSFMTLAAVFVEEAEERNDYRGPLRRMMEFLGKFNAALHEQYDPSNNSARADAFRATYMAAALSYGMNEDLRPRFKELNFPINNETYVKLMGITGTYVLPIYNVNPMVRTERGRIVVKGAETEAIMVYQICGRRYRGLLWHREHGYHFLPTVQLPTGIYLFAKTGGKEGVSRMVVP